MILDYRNCFETQTVRRRRDVTRSDEDVTEVFDDDGRFAWEGWVERGRADCWATWWRHGRSDLADLQQKWLVALAHAHRLSCCTSWRHQRLRHRPLHLRLSAYRQPVLASGCACVRRQRSRTSSAARRSRCVRRVRTEAVASRSSCFHKHLLKWRLHADASQLWRHRVVGARGRVWREKLDGEKHKRTKLNSSEIRGCSGAKVRR